MKKCTVFLAAAVAASALTIRADVAGKVYDANWESLNTRPCPQWWKDAKFGIFVHWGLYSVPARAPRPRSTRLSSRCAFDMQTWNVHGLLELRQDGRYGIMTTNESTL